MTETFGESIRGHRQQKGWTLKDLAAATSLSIPYLSDLERRPGANPTLDTLSLIAAALDRSVADLLSASDFRGRGSSSLPRSLLRFVKTNEFQEELRLLARRDEREFEEVRSEVIGFLAVAPKRSSGELSTTDWRRLMDVYRVITDER